MNSLHSQNKQFTRKDKSTKYFEGKILTDYLVSLTTKNQILTTTSQYLRILRNQENSMKYFQTRGLPEKH